MADHPKAITDEATERQIQDAAQVLLDLCLAACPAPPQDVPDVQHYQEAQAMSVAIQAVFMVDHLQVGKALSERSKGVKAITLRTRAFGLGVGVGQCLSALTDPVGFMMAAAAFAKGMEAGHISRESFSGKGKP